MDSARKASENGTKEACTTEHTENTERRKDVFVEKKSPVPSPVPSVVSVVKKGWPEAPPIPPEIVAERERLSSAMELVKEAWRHLNGAQGHAPSDRLARAMNACAEIETLLGLRILGLGGRIAGDGADRRSVFDAADVSGKIRFNQSLRCGPLSVSLIEVDGAYEVFVALASRATINIGFNGAGTLDFHAVTAGLDYPEVVEADASLTQALRHSGTQTLPLVSIGQGDSTVEIHEEDLR